MCNVDLKSRPETRKNPLSCLTQKIIWLHKKYPQEFFQCLLSNRLSFNSSDNVLESKNSTRRTCHYLHRSYSQSGDASMPDTRVFSCRLTCSAVSELQLCQGRKKSVHPERFGLIFAWYLDYGVCRSSVEVEGQLWGRCQRLQGLLCRGEEILLLSLDSFVDFAL